MADNYDNQDSGGTNGIKIFNVQKTVAQKFFDAKTEANAKYLSKSSVEEFARKIESPSYVEEYIKDRKSFFPSVDFQDPKNFVKFGLAEEYYKKSIENIYKTYPYDGSLKEKLEWHNSSSYIDNYIFENEYPRTNGYIHFGPKSRINGSAVVNSDDRYILTTYPQYVAIKGGPHAPSVPAYTTGSYDKELSIKEKEQKANIFNTTSSQIQNMTIDGQYGNTVEFWYKYPTNPLSDQCGLQYSHFSYFDLWNEQTIGSVVPGSEYGRFLIETKQNSSNQFQESCLFNLTYMSGASGVASAKLGSLSGAPLSNVASDYGIALSDWNHYAFSVINNPTGSDHLLVKLYINGNLVETVHTGSQIAEVKEGPFNANLGAYRTGPNATAVAAGVNSNGYGSISGSFDEFRYWTKVRNSEEIKLFSIDQVGGGTNTDYGYQRSKFSGSANPVNLGIYYKFNEGIIGGNQDKVMLDYSGRVSNGFYHNYDDPGTTGTDGDFSTIARRNIGSAFVESGLVQREFKDPIVYGFNPDVHGYLTSSIQKGREFDDRNTMSIYHSLPSWIQEQDAEKERFTTKALTQIVSSYFDELYLQIKQLSSLKHDTYPSGSVTGSFVQKPMPFAEKLLTNMGFVAPEIFSDIDSLAEFLNRDEDKLYERKIFDIRNQIYYNIYNNLNFINKSKGTENSIRNLIRCFGVNDEVYNINFYANNAKLDLRRAAQLKEAYKTYADFTSRENFGASVFQSTASSNSNSVSFITGSNMIASSQKAAAWDSELGLTVESEIIFPKKPSFSNPGFSLKHYGELSSSLFGMHTAIIDPSALTPSSNENELTWADRDYANFQVYACRDKVYDSRESSVVKFLLTGSNVTSTIEGVIPELTTSFFYDTYEDQKWNFAVKVYPDKYPNVGILSGSEDTRYKIEFVGYNVVGDAIQSSFHLTSSMSETAGVRFLSSNKRLYVGSHRENFTGSLLNATDVKISSCRYWATPLDNKEILSHALDPKNFGVFNALKPVSPLFDRHRQAGQAEAREVPRLKTLWLNWDFDTLTGSDTGVDGFGGEFSVLDFSSGSGESRYGYQFSSGSEKHHTGRGAFFKAGTNYTGSLSREMVFGLRQQAPDNLNSSQAIQVLERDDQLFTPSTRPISFLFTIEKSMYQSISEEMINFLAAAVDSTDLENLIGEPVNRYRQKYKSLEKIRNIFFERVGNTPDIEKYLDYFKWLDTAVSQMILNLVPASSEFSKVSNVVESHIFERNKYWTKFPSIAQKPRGLPAVAVKNEVATAVDGSRTQVHVYNYDDNSSHGRGTGGGDSSFPRGSKPDSGGDASYPTGRPVRTEIPEGSLTWNEGFRPKRWSTDHSTGEEAGEQVVHVVRDDDNETGELTWTPDETEIYTPKTANAMMDRTDSRVTSGDSTVDRQRNLIRDVIAESTATTTLRKDYNRPASESDPDSYHKTGGTHVASTAGSNSLQGAATMGGASGNSQARSRPKKGINKRQAVFANLRPGHQNTIQFRTSTLQSGSNVAWHVINPLRTYKPEFKVSLKTLPTVATAAITTSGGPLNNETFTLINAVGLAVGFIFKHSVTTVDGTKDGANVIIGVNGALGSAASVGERIRDAINASGAAITAIEETGPLRITLTQQVVGFSGNTPIDMSGVTTVTATNFAGGGFDNTDGIFYPGRMVSPYVFFSGSYPNNEKSAAVITGYTITSQHLQDYYVDIKEVPMQSPFTEQHVGGYAYRHGGLMLGMGSYKPEAWHTTVTQVGNDYIYTLNHPFNLPSGENLPRADFMRDETAKRPVNIRNIKSTNETSLPQNPFLPPVNELGSTKDYIGNYEKDYQVVQTSGRDTNNRYVVRSGSVSTVGAESIGTPSISGSYNWQIPNRGRNEHIFASRFSAPGGPEVLGSAFRDSFSNTYSPYNALPFRNLSVRQPLQTLLTKHSSFGGYDSTSRGAGTAATAAITCPTPGALLGGASFTLQNSVGLVTTYVINGGGAFATQPGGTAGATVQVFFGGASTTANVVEAVRKAINATINSNMTALDTDSTTVTVTQSNVGSAGNKTNTAGSSGLTVPNFTGGVDRLAAYHKTNRNPARRVEESDIFGTLVTGTVNDNAFIQHAIPRTDMSYLWISSSYVGNQLFGYQKKDFTQKSFASTDITFVSSSITGSNQHGGGLINTDFIGLNSVVVNNVDLTGSNKNTLSFTFNTDLYPANQDLGSLNNSSLILNAINSNRGGPSLFSSWQQARNSDNPVVRKLKNSNLVSLIKESFDIRPGSRQNIIKKRVINHYEEPPITFKYKPLDHTFIMNDGSEAEILNTYGNSLCGFANNEVNTLLGFYPYKNKKTPYDKFKKIYIEKQIPEELSPFESFKDVTYSETIYPKEKNTGLSKVRGRENYTVSSGSAEFNVRLGDSRAFWKDDINDRLRSDAEARNTQGLVIASGSSYFGLTDMSIWPLDSEEPFFDLYMISSSAGRDGKFDPFYWAPLEPSSAVGGLSPDSTTRFRNVNKNGELSYAGYIYGLFGINIQGKIRAQGAPTASGPLPNFKGDGVGEGIGLNFKPTASFQYEFPNMMMSGSMQRVTPIEGSTGFVTGFKPTASLHLIAPYRTDVLSGKTPWFNSYEDYSEDIRRIAKNYTVLPEFRISDHIDYYLKEGFFADNNKFLSLVGSSLNSTSSAVSENGSFQPDFFKIYSHSDFMKHFSVLQEDHKENDTAFVSKIKLKASAVKKLLPYQGFYPALRSVQLGHLFSSSYAPFIGGSNVRDGDQERLAALYQPFFAPGVFFNTIKSGIAVQYPVHTGTMPSIAQAADEIRLQMPTSGAVFISSYYDTTPNYAFPFESILDPDQYLPLSSSLTSSTQTQLSSSVYLVYPNFTGSWAETKADGFYVAQTTQFPYTTPENQPQMYFEWKGQSDPKYSLAASNFFAESVDFFLEKGTLTSFISKTEKDFKSMVSGSTYYMDVLLYKTDDFVSYEGPPSGTFNYDAGKEYMASVTDADVRNALIMRAGDGLYNQGISARGMHYGPAYTSHSLVYGSTGTGSVPFAPYRVQDPAYAPHTPPYFYGTSRARLAFKPDKVRDMVVGEAAKFTLEEILSNARIETAYENENQRSRTLQENSYRNNYAAGIAQMQLSSSVNLFGQITLKEVEYDTERNPNGSFKARGATTPVVQGTNDAWIIETKFECPSVNLAHMDTASLGAGIGNGKEKYHTRGIWKGYGVIPSGSEGLFLQLKESYPQVTNDIGGSTTSEVTGSLIDVCGFRASKERVGKIRSTKQISEAIIAIPIDSKGSFFSIPKDMFEKQKLNHEKQDKAILKGDFGSEEDIIQTSITQMIEKMDKYVIPPQMDFLKNPNVDPFVMYIFEFTHNLTKQDLADIWQNLMPEISRTPEKQVSSIEHPMGVKYEFFGQYDDGKLPSDIKWMVFKVKQKARNNFFNVTQQSEVAKGFTFTALNELQGVSSNPEAELPYSYNWPYDFFSLIELAQIDTSIKFSNNRERQEIETIDKKTSRVSREVKYSSRTDKEKTRETYRRNAPKTSKR